MVVTDHHINSGGAAARRHSPKPPVAACIVGLERSFLLSAVRTNIFQSMVEPLEPRPDVFVSLNSSRPRAVVAEDARLFSPRDVTLRSPDGPQLGALDCHTACWPRILHAEKLRRQRYTWVMRLRTDIMYARPLPPYSSWPTVEGNVVFVEACGAGRVPAPLAEELETSTCNRTRMLPGNNATGLSLGCVKDTWALVARGAADSYFNRTLLKSVHAEASRAGYRCLTVRRYECRLGCALHLRGADVRVLPLPRQIVRSRVDRTGNATTAHPLAFRSLGPPLSLTTLPVRFKPHGLAVFTGRR